MLVDVEMVQLENAALRAQFAELLSTNTKLVSEIAKLNDRLAELLAITQRKPRKTATSSEKKPESAPVAEAASALVVEPAAQQAFETRPKPPMLPEKTKGPKERARRTRRNPIPAHLETEDTPGAFEAARG